MIEIHTRTYHVKRGTRRHAMRSVTDYLTRCGYEPRNVKVSPHPSGIGWRVSADIAIDYGAWEAAQMEYRSAL